MQPEENTYWREAQTPRGAGHEANNFLEEMLNRPAGQPGGLDLERAVADRPLLAFGAAVATGFMLGSMGDEVGAPYNRGHGWLKPLDRELELVKSAALAAITTVATQSLREIVPGQTGEAITSMINRKLQDMGVPTGQRQQSGFGGQSSFGGSQYEHQRSNYGGYQESWQGHSQANLGGQSGFGPSDGRSQRAGTGIGHDTGGGFGGTQASSAPNTSFDTGAGRGAVGYDSPPAQGGSISIENTRVQGSSHLDPYYPPGGADRPIAGGPTPGRDRVLDTHETLERKPGEGDRG
jgi:hypothetical protein